MKKCLIIIYFIIMIITIQIGCVTDSSRIYPTDSSNISTKGSSSISPTDSSSISQFAKKPAREYTEIEVQSYIKGIGKKYDSPGFKGLHIGMTIEEVNELIKETPWGYAFSDSKNKPALRDYIWKDQPQYKSSNFLKGDDSQMGIVWAKIGCEGPDGKGGCNWIKEVSIRFHENKLVEIILRSPKWSADKIDTMTKDWGKFALNGLTKRYGEPTTIYDTFSNVNILSFKAGYSISLYKWDYGSDTVKLSISEYESKFGCNIIYENVEGVRKLEKEKSKGESDL